MSESPYRTAPPAEWPRSLRAAYALGVQSTRATGDLGIGLFAFVVAMSMAMGGAIGAGAALDYKRSGEASAPPLCLVRSAWDGNAPVRHGFALMSDGDRIGRFDTIDAAIEAAGKVGCKVAP